MARRIRLSRLNTPTNTYTRIQDADLDHLLGGADDIEVSAEDEEHHEGGSDREGSSRKIEDDRKYRLGPFAPRWLQPMNNLLCFMAWYMLMILGWSFSALAPGIPHIEKQYGLTSKMSAFLGSVQDIGGLSLMLFVSYVGTKLNMARGVAIGSFLYGIGALVICIPHYMESAAKIEITENRQNATDLDICPLTNVAHNVSHAHSTDSAHYTTYVILVIAISYTASAAGAAISSVTSGFIVDHLYVDFDKADPADIPADKDDPNWIGAWWLPFQIAAVWCMLVAIPLYGYPKTLPGVKRNVDNTDKVDSEDKDLSVLTMVKTEGRNFLSAAKILLTNVEFLMLSIATAVTTCAAIGIGMFSYKYLTEQYDLSLQVAGYIMGSKAVVTGLTFILGGWIIRHFKLHALGIERLSVGLSLTSAIVALGLLARCPNVKLSGVEVPYVGENITSGLLSECQGQCQCQGHAFNPVCGADDMVYYSPCHAGCQHKTFVGNDTVYTNCSCVSEVSAASGLTAAYTARAGRCELGCYGVYISTPLTYVMLLFAVMSISNESIATLRCVDQNLRSFALGIQWIIMRLLGNIPSPVFLGAILDGVCQLWSDPVQGEGTRYCQLYDREKLSYAFCFTWLTGNLFSGLLFLLASYFNLRKKRNTYILDDLNTDRPERESEEL